METPFISGLSPDANNFKVIGPLWQRFMAVASRIPNRVGHDMFGVMYWRPEAQRGHPHELQYIARAPVSSTSNVPDGMIAYTVPECTFAVFTHRGRIEKLGETLEQAYRDWLPNSNYRHAGIADVELYDDRFCHGGPDSEMEYWISVKPK